MAAGVRRRFGDGLFNLLGVRLVVWLIAAQAFLPGVLNDPPLSGTIPLQRVIAGTEALCSQLASGTASD